MSQRHLRPYASVLETIGWTPLIRLSRITSGVRTPVYGKAEFFNLPDKMSQEKVRLLRAFGADVVITPSQVPPDHPDNYIMKAKAIAAETPNAILANQFYNRGNPDTHFRTTGPELWQETEGRITHLVGGAGTGGTLSGAGRYLKEQNPAVSVIAADPEGSIFAEYARTGSMSEARPYKVEGLGGDKLPGTLDFEYVDEFVR